MDKREALRRYLQGYLKPSELLSIVNGYEYVIGRVSVNLGQSVIEPGQLVEVSGQRSGESFEDTWSYEKFNALEAGVKILFRVVKA